MMSAQIEMITTTTILQPFKSSVLRRLQKLIQANEVKNWFYIYLCLFILLHSCSILTADENKAAKKYGLNVSDLSTYLSLRKFLAAGSCHPVRPIVLNGLHLRVEKEGRHH